MQDVVYRGFIQQAVLIDNASAMRQILKDNPPAMVYPAKEVETRSKTLFANFILLKRHIPALSQTGLALLTKDIPADGLLVDFPGATGYRIMRSEELYRCSAYRKLMDESDRKKRLLGYPAFVVKTFCETLPKNIWAALHD